MVEVGQQVKRTENKETKLGTVKSVSLYDNTFSVQWGNGYSTYVLSAYGKTIKPA